MNKTDEEGRYCHDFFIAYELTQIVDNSNRVPNTKCDHATHLDVILMTSSEICSAEVLLLLGTSDHSLINVDAKLKVSLISHFIRRAFGTLKLTGTASDLILKNFPFTLSLKKTVLPKQTPSFLNQSF